jgi:hypothetical protein
MSKDWSSAGFSLRILVLAKEKPRRLKPGLLNFRKCHGRSSKNVPAATFLHENNSAQIRPVPLAVLVHGNG